jgi:hypothetical protein
MNIGLLVLRLTVSVNPTGSVFRLAEQGHQDFLATI